MPAVRSRPLVAFPALLLAAVLWAAPVQPVTARPASGRGAATVRYATFNVSLFRPVEGQLVADLSTPDDAQAQAVAAIIQRQRPDVLLVNEFDYDAAGRAVELFARNYLEVAQEGSAPIRYPYRMAFPSNTGIASGFDLNNDGQVGTSGREYGDDAFGFGVFPGQYGFAVYSRFPLVTSQIRTFQRFLWKDMPGALLPDDPSTPAPADWYSPQELAVFRLSSKNHVDVPVRVGRQVVHLLASHPTPPSFDGPEDRNGTRNHDEIRLWADYVSPGRRSAYIVDDAGRRGGLRPGARFVVAGDLNADPADGGGIPGAIDQLLDHPLVAEEPVPDSAGAVEQAALQGGANDSQRGDPAFDTADFSDGSVGNLRVDYVLPRKGMRVTAAAVFWPLTTDPDFNLVGTFPFPSSDHRLVRVDVALPPGQAPR
ncbi:MAG: endonuclease/exonuclease/phosphatase family protein [Euzebyales bacterium]|nr:endonuclease/exonuclease/phosphatase family protein [Euzebyales bacterium]